MFVVHVCLWRTFSLHARSRLRASRRTVQRTGRIASRHHVAVTVTAVTITSVHTTASRSSAPRVPCTSHTSALLTADPALGHVPPRADSAEARPGSLHGGAIAVPGMAGHGRAQSLRGGPNAAYNMGWGRYRTVSRVWCGLGRREAGGGAG